MAFDDLSLYGGNNTSTAKTVASQRTQNGYPVDGPLRTWSVPGVNKQLTLTADPDAAVILLFVAASWHRLIGPITGNDTGGYSKRPIGSLGGTTSNHRSGTAVDHQWNTYPQGTRKMSAAHIGVCQQLTTALGGVWRWGGNYGGSSLVDQQHGEINAPPGSARTKQIADQIRAGSISIGGTAAPAATTTNSVSAAGTTSAAPAAAVVAPLPVIGAAKQQPILPLFRAAPAFLDNRLTAVTVSGKVLRGDVTAAVVQAAMSFSSQQVGQFQLVLIDSSDAEMFHTGLFAEGTALDYGDQHLDVRGVSLSSSAGGPRLTVNARSRIISELRSPANTGRGTWGSRDVTQWVTDTIRTAGGYPVVQPGLGAQTITRQATSDTPETTWAVMVRVAAALGCWCYEFEQIVTFARPSWLVARPDCRAWEITWNSWSDYSPGLVGMPAYTSSYDGDTGQALHFSLVSADAYKARPGDLVRVAGRLGPAVGDWVVTAVTVPTTLADPVVVSATRVIDPVVPAAPTAAA